MTVTLHGIRNCDTVKKARLWLEAKGVDYAFHDFKTDGVSEAQLESWCDQVGWESPQPRRHDLSQAARGRAGGPVARESHRADEGSAFHDQTPGSAAGRHDHRRFQARRLRSALRLRRDGRAVLAARPLAVRSRVWSRPLRDRPCWACRPARSGGDGFPPPPRAMLDALGTTKSWPGRSVTSPSRIRMVSRPLRTKKKSSVSGCECQTNSPCTFTTMTSWPLKPATTRGDHCSPKLASLAARSTGSRFTGSPLMRAFRRAPPAPAPRSAGPWQRNSSRISRWANGCGRRRDRSRSEARACRGGA